MISHHPSQRTLAAYAVGDLPEALAVVAATHLACCPICCDTVARLEAAEGARLETTRPVALRDEALTRVLARLDEPPPATFPVLNPGLPAPLDRAAFGRQWPIGPGRRWRPLKAAGSARGGLLLLQPGSTIPAHGHTGMELTCVLAGAFLDGTALYQHGDVAEPAADHERPLVATGDRPCLCVIGFEGIRLRGLPGWIQRRLG